MIIAWLKYYYHNSVLERDTSAIQGGDLREQLGEYNGCRKCKMTDIWAESRARFPGLEHP